MEYSDSSWTKRRRINAKVQEHLRVVATFKNEFSSNEDVVTFETSSRSSKNQNKQLTSRTVCDTKDSQHFGNLNEELECRAERDQESDSEERRQISDSEERRQISD